MKPFTPSAPKPSATVTFASLQEMTVSITSAKTVGDGTLKLITTGTHNLFVSDGQKVRKWLRETFKVEA